MLTIWKDLLDDDLPLCQVDAILQIAENMFRILGVEEPGAVTLLMGVAHCFIKCIINIQWQSVCWNSL